MGEITVESICVQVSVHRSYITTDRVTLFNITTVIIIL